MKTYVEASNKGKMIFYSAILGSFVFGLLIIFNDTIFPIQGVASKQLELLVRRSLYIAISNTVFYMILAWGVLAISLKTARDRRWPPQHLPMPFKTKIKYLQSTTKLWLGITLVLACFLLNVASGYYTWFMIKKMAII